MFPKITFEIGNIIRAFSIQSGKTAASDSDFKAGAGVV
jgi:hypothetical protein